MTETGNTESVVEFYRRLLGYPNPAGSTSVPVVREQLEALLAVVEEAQEFAESCLDRGPAPLTGDGREQPDNVWFVGSANPLGLHLLDALARLHTQASDEGEAQA